MSEMGLYEPWRATGIANSGDAALTRWVQGFPDLTLNPAPSDTAKSKGCGPGVSLRSAYLTSTGFAVPAARFRVFSLNDSSSEGTQYSSLSSVTPLGSCKLKTCIFLTKGAT